MGLIALVAIHLTAHVVYALRRDPTPLTMFTGRKRVSAEVNAATDLWLRAVLTAGTAAFIVWAGGLMP